MNLTRKNLTILLSAALISVSLLSVSILSYSGYLSSPKDRPKGVCANYDQQEKVITVTCNSTLADVHNTIADDNVLKKETSEGIWFLNSSVVVSKEAILTINNKDAKWIKINSEDRSSGNRVPGQDQEATGAAPYFLQIFGRLDLQGVKITSWNPLAKNYAKQKSDGTVPRPYITVGDGAGPSHLQDSEIAYLGYNTSHKQGLSFYGGDGSTLTGNNIHDLWYGFYSTGVGDMVIENNTVHDNFKYGIDPHTGSHDMKIRNNDIHNSRIGLICSLECSNLIFEKNRIEGNKEVGLMFSKKTVNSTARLNNISLSDTGIAVSDSHSNSVYDNAVSRSVDGLSVKNNSSDNMLFNNTISDPKDCGIIVALAAQNNTMASNYVRNYTESGICLSKGANHNVFRSNVIDGLGQYGINIKGGDVKGNRFNDNVIQLSGNAIRLSNNTGTLFINNLVGNTNDYEYIISSNSTLNLVKTRFVGDVVRAAGTEINTVNIINSSIIDVVTERAGANDTSSRYDTNVKPYVGKLSYMTIKIYSRG
jgi:poly(beta-D-mannuronate) C5 epimerase